MPLSCREDDHAISRSTRLEGIKELNARRAASLKASRIATVAPALIWGATYSQGNGGFGGRLSSPHHSVFAPQRSRGDRSQSSRRRWRASLCNGSASQGAKSLASLNVDSVRADGDDRSVRDDNVRFPRNPACPARPAAERRRRDVRRVLQRVW